MKCPSSNQVIIKSISQQINENSKLMKKQVDERTNQWKYKLIKQQFDKTAISQQVVETAWGC